MAKKEKKITQLSEKIFQTSCPRTITLGDVRDESFSILTSGGSSIKGSRPPEYSNCSLTHPYWLTFHFNISDSRKGKRKKSPLTSAKNFPNIMPSVLSLGDGKNMDLFIFILTVRLSIKLQTPELLLIGLLTIPVGLLLHLKNS
ncbi:hypothetical protein AVEN_178010-1 [Araneus ventricosus]|uniref:Uncharacterized protein n=1 Tax=Araneus ventricosus TaxID=182803 RepID=A0A4Y2K4N7_ARAVE|nr:hypothetical protein AVEN_178010-1 [Araneus ventricosus]